MSLAPKQARDRLPGAPEPGEPESAGRGSAAVGGAEVAPPPKMRRRPLLIAASVAAVCLGALLGVLAFTSMSSTTSVVAVRSTVHRGEVIEADDLMAVQVGVDPALTPIPAADLQSLVGQRAAMDLAAGGLVTRQDVTRSVLPADGMSVVGVSLPPGGLPGTALQAGDQVRIVSTPGMDGTYRGSGSQAQVKATVVSVRQLPDGGQQVVDVSVPRDQAADLVARAATGKVALVLDSRAR
ncbi:SAF domain-containing protein [Segeticoccus rhizosphaerae]|uniref:SAF domain-containing protein n=1 Tax=Segeticoccus rhizosphaerae TaxID=1104777 RepID=UPI001EF11192|nr:SAF domain-containing protein [Segeticoccus rhizosphaerae]